MVKAKSEKVQPIIARHNHAPQSPYKVRVVAGAVRHLSLEAALAALRTSPKKAAKSLLKVLNAAVANAAVLDRGKPSELRISSLMIGEGPTLKRMRAKSRGRAGEVLKRTSNIRVVLEELAQSSKPKAPNTKQKPNKKQVNNKSVSQSNIKDSVSAAR